jgi:predicted dehydrogenase
LTSLGCEVAVLSSRDIDAPLRYRTLTEALAWQPGYVVVANRTSEHYRTLVELAGHGFSGTVLVEKPLFHEEETVPSLGFERSFVGYNLRFHPVLQKLRGVLRNEKLISAECYVGGYLPDWRPGTDYRESYSAAIKMGGGVLRDLSHELDYLNWLLGGWERLIAVGGHYSSLEIESDDAWVIMMSTRKCPLVSLQMNYLDRAVRRRVLINTNNHTIEADLEKGSILIDDKLEKFRTERDFTYTEQHRAVLENRSELLCTLEEGIDVMRMIHAAEQSVKKGEWISR